MTYRELTLSTHAFVKKSELTRSERSLRQLCTVRSVFDPDKEVALYRETPTMFGFPRHYQDFSRLAESVNDRRSNGMEVAIPMADDYAPRESQIPMLDAFCTRVQNGKTGFLVEAPTGSGKTVLGIRMLSVLGVLPLVIVPRASLVDQWRERILRFTTLTEKDIGMARQDVCDYRGKKVVIGLIHSLAKDKYPAAFKRAFGAILWDEVHVVGAETFSQTAGMFPARYRIGMSATPKRKDGLSDVIKLTLAETVIRPPASGSATLVVPKVFIRSYETGVVNTRIGKLRDALSRRGMILSALAEDTARNALIATFAKKFGDSNRRVLILSDRSEQLDFLKDVLVKRHGVPQAWVGIFTSKTKPADRDLILKNAGYILATYGVMAMGVDVPDLRALIFATPQADVTQSSGRILRLCEGAKQPVILDIVDTAYPDCVEWGKQRQRYYRTTARAELISLAG